MSALRHTVTSTPYYSTPCHISITPPPLTFALAFGVGPREVTRSAPRYTAFSFPLTLYVGPRTNAPLTHFYYRALCRPAVVTTTYARLTPFVTIGFISDGLHLRVVRYIASQYSFLVTRLLSMYIRPNWGGHEGPPVCLSTPRRTPILCSPLSTTSATSISPKSY